MIYDPSVSYDVVTGDIPAVPFVDYWSNLFTLNDTFMDHLHEKHESCGYKEFMETAMTFPPTGPLPTPPDVDEMDSSCRLFNEITDAAMLVNPCWDIYQVATTCPLLWDVLGFPGSFSYQPPGSEIYFNRTDVQKAINAPIQEWEECSNGVLDTDNSPPSGLSVLPRVIEKNKRTIIAHAKLDMVRSLAECLPKKNILVRPRTVSIDTVECPGTGGKLTLSQIKISSSASALAEG
jgi:carboxypeptidase D